MKKLLLILLCLPFIGFGKQTYVADNHDIIMAAFFFFGHILFAVLILQAGQKLNSQRLQVAAFLYMFLTLIALTLGLDALNLL
tara:strand:- start:51 stop:299 length:249 start_codon:yes stop_codon:yes gene_type:complete